MTAFEDGQLRVVVDRSFSLSDVAEEQAYLETNASVGKVLLVV